MSKILVGRSKAKPRLQTICPDRKKKAMPIVMIMTVVLGPVVIDSMDRDHAAWLFRP